MTNEYEEYDEITYDLGSASVNYLKREVTRRVKRDGVSRTLFVSGLQPALDKRKQRVTGGWAIATDENYGEYKNREGWHPVYTVSEVTKNDRQ